VIYLFKAAVYWIHVLLGILVVLLGIAPMFSIAAPDPNQTYGVWFSMIAIDDKKGLGAFTIYNRFDCYFHSDSTIHLSLRFGFVLE
jgi:hypothetical protein